MRPHASIRLDALAGALPFAVVGTLCIVAGGLVSAILAHDPSRPAMWAVAYLVLVGGVAQASAGMGQALLGQRPPGGTWLAAELAAFNLGNAGVLGGTLTGQTWLVDAGGLVLAGSLVLFLLGSRGVRRTMPVMVYRALLVFVLGSIPVGLFLAHR
jgi:hypothetical protein